MSKQKTKKKLLKAEHTGEAEIKSLNGNLLNEFSIEELEARYETDPLMLSHFWGLVQSSDNGNVSLTSESGGCEKCKCYMAEYCPDCEKCFCKGDFSLCSELKLQ